MTVEILVGDVLVCLAKLSSESVDCVVTSPPYWGLRDYGVAGQLGLEPTLGEHIEAMVAVFTEVRRVLKKTGTVWINYGDCYATAPNGRSAAVTKAAVTKAAGGDDRTFRDKPFSTIGSIHPPESGQPFPNGVKRRGGGNNSSPGLKPKDLCMVPNRLAIALQENGWWVRSEIIWAKTNPMPESITDRPASSHEKVFMLTKSARYFYDAEAVREAATASSVKRWQQNIEEQDGSTRAHGGTKSNGPMKAVGGKGTFKRADSKRGAAQAGQSMGTHRPDREDVDYSATPTRNLRNVWSIATKPFSEAHFATFPPELPERCIRAGCPVGGTVLDPFGGAGTTGLVADRLQRDAILIELNPDYAALAHKRIAEDKGGLFDAPVLSEGE